MGRFFTHYVWRPLEGLGLKDPSPASSRHEAQRKALAQWTNENRRLLVCGHTHYQEHDGYYWNIGSGVIPGVIECIELRGGRVTIQGRDLSAIEKEARDGAFPSTRDSY